MNIIDAIQDENLFRPFLADADGEIGSWVPWLAALRILYGLPIKSTASQAIIARTTGRAPAKLPSAGFRTALFLTGRRSGKSRVAALIGAYEAVLAGHEQKLAKGEPGVVAICAPTKNQGRIVKDYLRAIFTAPMLANLVDRETGEGFDLTNRIRIEIMAGDWKTIRGFTLVAAIIDEICFFGYDAECKVKSDTELVRAIEPSLATVRGRLVGISSPYAKRCWAYTQYQRHYGNEAGRVLVLNAPSTVLNPTLDQSEVDEALADDLQAAKSEFLGEWRDDVGEFLPRSVIENLVVVGRSELLPEHGIRYFAFADLSGGRSDAAALAIAHREHRAVIIDYLRAWKPPFSPHHVIGEMCEDIRRYRIRRVTGDNYAAEFVVRAFEGCGIRYIQADKPKSVLYTELLPRMCSGEIQLPDNTILVDQLSALERRTRSGGRDIIDHPPGGHDDLANAVAGAAAVAGVPVRVVGCF
jgi:hypothetical protein